MRSILVSLGLLAGLTAQAAQWGRVTSTTADVYDKASGKRKVIRKVKRGTMVQASNYPTEGLHKCRLQDGSIGWIRADALLLKGPPLETADAPARKKNEKEELEPDSDELPPPLPDN